MTQARLQQVSYFIICIALITSALIFSPIKNSAAEQAQDLDQGGSLLSKENYERSPALIHPQISSTQQAEIENLRFNRIANLEGLSSNYISSITQDGIGYLWVATLAGLNKYDGYSFSEFHSDTYKPNAETQINTLFPDKDRNLWIGTNLGLLRFHLDTGELTSYTNIPGDQTSLASGSVNAIMQDSKGNLWVGVSRGLNRFDQDSQTFSHFLSTPVSDIIEDQSGALWITTHNGLFQFDLESEKFTYYRHDPQDPRSISTNFLGEIFEDSEGYLWIATYNGLNRMDKSATSFTLFQNNPTDPSSLSDNEVTDIFEDSKGRLWIGTLSGLNLYDPSTMGFSHIQHDPSNPSSLSDNLISSIFEDQSGVLWIGTFSGGLNKLSTSSARFQDYPPPVKNPDQTADTDQISPLNTLRDAVIMEVYEDSRGTIWIGSLVQGLFKFDRNSGEIDHFQHDPEIQNSLRNNTINAIYEDSSGDIWIGSNDGLDLYNSRSESFEYQPISQNYSVGAILETKPGELFVGTSNGLHRLFRTPNGTLKSEYYRLDPTYTGKHSVIALHRDTHGSLWVGTVLDGIYVLHPGDTEFTHLGHDPKDPGSLSTNSVYDIYEDQHGVIWVGTILGGLNRFDRAANTFTHLTESDGLAGDWVTCIQEDREGYLWLATNHGITKFDPQTGEIYNFGSLDGLQGGEVTSCTQGDQGLMYFGGLQGLNVFYPDQIEINTEPPRMVISAVNLFNQTIRTDLTNEEHIRLPYDENFLSFDYAALDYNAPEKNQYAYMMEGLDQEWVYAGSRRHAEYPGLEPGEYIFRVKGSNNDGVWNETGTAVNISIQPPFWSTLWFQGIVLVILIAAAVGGYQWRVRSLQARSRELEYQVEERTSELELRTIEAEQQRKEIEALYLADEELHRYLHMDQVLGALLETAVDNLQGDKAVLMVWDKQHEQLITQATVGFAPDTVSKMSFAPLEGLAGYVVDTGEPVIIEDSTSDSSSNQHIYEAEGIHAFIMVPIKISGEIFGVFSVAYLDIHRFTGQERRLLIALAQRAALAIENARLYEQSQELASIQERNRIARDLHDSVTQSLFGVNMYADAVEHFLNSGKIDSAAENLTKLHRTARDALGQMRLLIYRLRPPILEEEGLAAALEARLETVETRAGLETKLELTGMDELPQEVENELYSIAIEALNNTLKHANAEHVSVIMNQENGVFSMEITDDGRGFDLDSAQERGGLGLLGMQERVAQLGGQFKVESQPGLGTSIIVTVEFDQ